MIHQNNNLPVNDLSGFAPDLYDVDWSTIKRIEVLRGPAPVCMVVVVQQVF